LRAHLNGLLVGDVGYRRRKDGLVFAMDAGAAPVLCVVVLLQDGVKAGAGQNVSRVYEAVQVLSRRLNFCLR
jgi:hypothetical protein